MARPPKFEIGVPYIFKWHDAQYDDSQGTGGDEGDDIGRECFTVGFVVRETSRGVRIAMEKDVRDDYESPYRFFFDIVKRTIVSAQKIKEVG